MIGGLRELLPELTDPNDLAKNRSAQGQFMKPNIVGDEVTSPPKSGSLPHQRLVTFSYNFMDWP